MFVFRLEAVLQHRQFIEDACKRELAQCLERLTQEKKKFHEFSAARRDAEGRVDALSRQGGSIQDHLLYIRYLDRLAVEIRDQKARVAHAEKQVAEKRRSMIAAMKKRKIMEKLKERQREAYEADLRREEQKFLSDMAVIRYVYQAGQAGDAPRRKETGP